jgi:hypothetical protein
LKLEGCEKAKVALAMLTTLRFLGRRRPVGHHGIRDRSADGGGHYRYQLDQPPGSLVRSAGGGPAACRPMGGRSVDREGSSSEMGCSCQVVFSRSCQMIFAGSVSAVPPLKRKGVGKSRERGRFPVERSWPTSPGVMGFG